jgi:integrase/recombinase XerD
MISTHLEHLREKGYAEGSVTAARHWLERLERQFSGKLADLKPSDLTAFQQSLRWQPGPRGKLYAENSVNQAVEAVRRFYRWAVATGLVARDPSTHLVTRRPPPTPRRELTPTDARKLLLQPDISTFAGCRDRAILGLVLETPATSAGALVRLDLQHFQPDVGALLLQGRRREILSLSEGLCIDLVRYLREARPAVAKAGEQAFFVNSRGGRLVCGSIREIIRAHVQRAGVPRPHSPLSR